VPLLRSTIDGVQVDVPGHRKEAAMNAIYAKPTINEVGSLADVTLSIINKTAGSGDVIVINGISEPVDGGTVTSTSL
jgi:hypothetical protein